MKSRSRPKGSKLQSATLAFFNDASTGANSAFAGADAALAAADAAFGTASTAFATAMSFGPAPRPAQAWAGFLPRARSPRVASHTQVLFLLVGAVVDKVRAGISEGIVVVLIVVV
ncbi:hypothetical protein CRG98_026157 [Punica granatum]|uniref:Uncharacterized protein n=1 Tax=Punica granatum TaxID=22663 RepID=A0A2I0JB35_PUNGR|nr:hypothetical protein CRG98_026157 [Punica granatum]